MLIFNGYNFQCLICTEYYQEQMAHKFPRKPFESGIFFKRTERNFLNKIHLNLIFTCFRHISFDMIYFTLYQQYSLRLYDFMSKQSNQFNSIQQIYKHNNYHYYHLPSNFNQPLQQTMENDLIMNQLPLPKYFDGQSWNTVVKPARKYIPKYLHEDLPELRHLYIKEIFKSMGKFNCPNIQFFNKMIKPKNHADPNKKKQLKKSKTQNISYNDIKQQLQYALITTDRSSNIIDDLVIKAQKVKNSQKSNSNSMNNTNKNDSFRKRKIATSFSLDRHNKNSLNKQQKKQKYFEKTVDLVFKNRRNSFLQNLNKKTNENEEQVQKIYEKLNQMKLLSYQSEEEHFSKGIRTTRY